MMAEPFEELERSFVLSMTLDASDHRCAKLAAHLFEGASVEHFGETPYALWFGDES